MSTPVIASPGDLPPTANPPLTIQDAINSVAANTTYTIADQGQLVVVGPNSPMVSDQNKVWLRTSPCGIPLAWFRWNNCRSTWVRVITGLVGEIRMFCGDPTTYFDTTGLGVTTAEWDGWALCNGQNNTPDLRDKFICSGQISGNRFLAFFDAQNNGVSGGGNVSIKIQPYNIPVLTASFPFNDGFIMGTPAQYAYLLSGNTGGYNLVVKANGTGPALPLTILPPFIAQGYAMWVKGPC